MKIKTSELTGAALDWAVAVADGAKTYDPEEFRDRRRNFTTSTGEYQFRYHQCWSQGGPIIEQERIKLFPNVGGTWTAQIRLEENHPRVKHKVLAGWVNGSGPTPLIAAMRCYVASKLGDEVEIPEELI